MDETTELVGSFVVGRGQDHRLTPQALDGSSPPAVQTCTLPDVLNMSGTETVALFKLVRAGKIAEARDLYRWFMPLLHLDVSLRFVQNIKLAEHMVRGTSPSVRAPRLELNGEEKAAVEKIVAAALKARPDLKALAA